MSNAENVMCPHGMTLRDYFAAKAMGPAPGPWEAAGLRRMIDAAIDQARGKAAAAEMD